jgi:hypothetical protein
MLYNALIVRQVQSDGTPHLKSSIEKTHASVKSCKISSTVGIGYLSLITAVLTRRISTQIRTSPFGLGTTAKGNTHGVGQVTGSMMSKRCSSSSDRLLICGEHEMGHGGVLGQQDEF